MFRYFWVLILDSTISLHGHIDVYCVGWPGIPLIKETLGSVASVAIQVIILTGNTSGARRKTHDVVARRGRRSRTKHHSSVMPLVVRLRSEEGRMCVGKRS